MFLDKPIIEENEPSNEKLLEWNKEDIGLFDENTVKPSSISSPTVHDHTSKRQSRKTSKSIKQTITSNVAGANSQDESMALFKPNVNINPLLETGSGTNLEEDTKNIDSLYARPDPEIVKKKSQKRMESKDDPVTAVVNEFFDEEQPEDSIEVPPRTYDDDDDIKVEEKPNGDENSKPKDDTGDNDKTTVTQAPADDDIAATEDETTEDTTHPPPPTDTVPTDEAETQQEIATDEGSKELEQTGTEEDHTKTKTTADEASEEPDEEESTEISTPANTPLIKVAQSKPPSSPGKYGLKVRHHNI